MSETNDVAIAFGAPSCMWCRKLLPGRGVASADTCSPACSEKYVTSMLGKMIKERIKGRALTRLVRATQRVRRYLDKLR